MDPVRNPYAPGAGSAPPELAGRDEVRERVRVALERRATGRAAQSLVLVGLRGVGKTVLLDRTRDDAEAGGHETIRIEMPEGRSLPAALAPEIKTALLRLSLRENAREKAGRAIAALSSFVRSVKMTYGDIQLSMETPAEAGVADSGDLERDLADLLEKVGEAAQADGKTFALFLDELQYVEAVQLGALLAALQRMNRLKLPVLLVAAGLPQLRARAAEAKSYAERLLTFVEVGPLNGAASRDALVKPARAEEVEFEEVALDRIVTRTQGYPFFLQAWGSAVWDAAQGTPITGEDVARGEAIAVADLDASFFLVRFDRLTPAEKAYMAAMAKLGPGPHRSGDIARELGKKTPAVGGLRDGLIAKGMIWSPAHGDTAFSVPLFDEFLRRTMD